MPDPLIRWLDALNARHFAALNFQEVRRSVQALSALYVERRTRLGQGSAFDGAGKRAAFATYFAPLHFLLVREIVRALGAASPAVSDILDLGCGTGIAGAAWALEVEPHSRITGIDRNSWAIREAKWNCEAFKLRGAFRSEELSVFKIGKHSAVIAAFTMNELPDELRQRMRRELMSAAKRGSAVLVVEPIARSMLGWWPEWAREWIESGGREDEWRFKVDLPEPIALMDKAAGLDHRELTGRSLWMPGKAT